MADVQLTIVDQENTQIALAAPAETAVNVAVPGIQGPTGATGDVAVAQDGTAALPGIRFQSDTNTGIYRPGADQLAISTAGTGRLFVDANGNIGVGTGTINIAGYNRVDIGVAGVTGGLLTLRSAGGAQEANIICSSGGLAITTNSYATPFDVKTSEIIFGTGSSGTERLRITSDGKVGIGTSSPSTVYRTTINGDGSSIVGGLSLRNNGTEVLTIGTVTAADAANCEIWNNANGYLRFATNNTERLRITSDGKVGIGTSSPTQLLSIAGTSANILLSGTSNSYTTYNINASNVGYVGDANWLFGGSSSDFGVRATSNLVFGIGAGEKARIDSSGRLLVGTSTAQNKLTVESSINGDGATLSYSGVAGTGRSSLAFSAANNTPAQITIARVSGMLTSGSVGTEAGELYLETKQTSDAVPQVRVTVKASGIVNISNAPTYADNAAATTAGLAVGDVYRTATGQLMIRY